MSRWWDESGVLIGQCHYVDGVKQGTQIEWLVEPAGAISKITQYYNGEENGPYINFGDRGCIVSVGYLVDNKMSGEWTYWYPMQTMGERRGYGGGRMARFFCVADEKEGPLIAWHWDGAKKEEGSYRRDKRHGTWRYWREDGSFDRREVWEDGELIATESPSNRPSEDQHEP
jgi:antitoxin component YwqK of YwqJK toxin-antitoxin module